MGNICRSPAAEGIAKSILKQKNLNEIIEVDSAGTIDYHIGEPPDTRMIAHASKRGYNLDSLARQFDPNKDFEKFNYIITMDNENFDDIIALDYQSGYGNKVFKMTDFGDNKHVDGVPDPYYSGSKGFELVLDILENSVKGLIKKIEDDIRQDYKKSN
jgi:protein-tyrosine phosphatase